MITNKVTVVLFSGGKANPPRPLLRNVIELVDSMDNATYVLMQLPAPVSDNVSQGVTSSKYFFAPWSQPY